MADNTQLVNPSASVTGDTLKTDDLGGIKVQCVKVGYGVNDAFTYASTANPLPVAGAGTAGVPGTAVLTVQGIASGTAIPVSGTVALSGTSPVSGTVTANAGTGTYLVGGTGTAGTPTGGVLTVQGGVGGQAVPISGTVTVGTNAALVAGSAVIGKVGIDQTTPGSTNAVQVVNPIGSAVYIQPGTGVNLNTSAVTVSSSALPTGAATQTTSAAIQIGTDKLAAVTIATGTVAPANALVVGGNDGTNVRQLLTDNTGKLSVNVLNSPTVSNGGTFAVQDTQVFADNAAFTLGTSKVFSDGFVFNEVAGSALTEKNVAAARIDAKRAQVLVIEDATTRGQRLTVTAGGAVKTDGTATTQPISGTVSANAGTGNFNIVGTGTAGTPTGGVLTVQGSGTGTALPVSGTVAATQSGTWNVGGTGTAGSPAAAVLSVQGVATGTALAVSGTVTGNQGTGNTLANAWPIKLTDGTNTMPTMDAAARKGFMQITDGTRTATVTASNALLVDLSATTANTTPLKVDLGSTTANATPIKVDLGGTTANATAIKVDGSAVTNPVNVTQLAGGAISTVATGVQKVAITDSAGTSITLGTKVSASSFPVVLASDQASIAITRPDVTGTGVALGSLNANCTGVTSGAGSVGLQLASGTLSGTLTPEVSFDGGTNWTSTFFRAPATGLVSSTLVFAGTTTNTGYEILGVAGANQVRVRVSAYTSGTSTGTIRVGQMLPNPLMTTGPAGSVVSPITTQVGGSDGANLRTLLTDNTGKLYTLGTGAAANGAATSGNPSLVAGYDGANVRTLLTDATGKLNVIGTGAAASGAVLSGNPVLVAGSDGTNARSLSTDATGRIVAVGAGATGAVLVGNPVLVAGSDGTNTRNLSTDVSGRPTVVGSVAVGAAVAGNPVLAGGSDGTNARYLSTDATGKLNVIGIGTVANGAAVSGNPVQIAGSDGSNVRSLATDASGRPNVVGAAASGAAAAGNPVLAGGSDGTNARSIATDTNGVVKVGPVPIGTVVTAGANVAASANNQTLAGVVGKTTYLAGFAVSGLGATSAGSITITTTGLAANLSFVLPIPAGVTVGVSPLIVQFNPPLPASATNTSIAVNVPSFGAGNTTASASAWGSQA